MKRLLAYVWPKGNWAVKRRVILAFSLLVGAKVGFYCFSFFVRLHRCYYTRLQAANVTVPFIFRDIVNYYNNKAPEFLKLTLDTPGNAIVTAGVTLIIACKLLLLYSRYQF